MHQCSPRTASAFPAGMRLLSHWNLRDQIKADYCEKTAWRGSAPSPA